MIEQWRPITGYEGLYEVSDQGRVRSTKRQGTRGCMLVLCKNIHGYPIARFSKDGQVTCRTVHSLVAGEFIGPRPYGYDVMHLDGSRDNNAAINLQYGTRSENLQMGVVHGTHKQASKKTCPNGHPYNKGHPGARRCTICKKAYDAERFQRLGPRRMRPSKVGPDGRMALDEHGKVVKPDHYRPPNIAALLAGGVESDG